MSQTKLPEPSACGQRTRRRGILRLTAGLLALLCSLPALALDPAKSIFQFNCRNWTRQSGLPAQLVNSITQTKEGYLWLGTQHGLVRFDGLEFKVVPIDLPQAQGEDLRMISRADDGRVLFAVRFGGFGGYDGQKFSAVEDFETIPPGLNGNVIFQSRRGDIWTGADLGLHCSVKGKSGASFSDSSIGIILALCEDPAGRIWAGSVERGLFYWSDGKLNRVEDPALSKQNIFAVAADRSGQIWVGTGQGLRCYDAQGRPREIPLMNREVKALLVDSHGVLWIGTSGMGLGRYQDGKFSYFQRVDGLVHDYVSSVFEDAEGSLWVGTRDGLSQLTDVKFPIITSKEGYLEGSSLSVAPSQKGGLWITGASGAGYFDGKAFKDYTSDALFPNHYVKHAFEARNGDVYFADGDKNIDVLSGDQTSRHYPGQNWQTAFAEDSRSVLVAVGDSLFRLSNGELQPYEFKAGQEPPKFWINNLMVARDDAIWVSSQSGIFRLRDGAVKQWTTAEGLPGNVVYYAYEDEDGSVWLGLSTGIARIKNDQLKVIQQDKGLFENCVYAVVPDDRGYLWMDSRRGIFRVTRKSLNEFADGLSARIQCEAFDGLESIKSTDRIDQEFSGCRTTDGRIWFPSPLGVIVVDPANVPVNRTAPPVFIDRIRGNGHEFSRRENIVISPGKGELEFHFTALSFIAPQKILFRYQLEGYDKSWVETRDRRLAFYTNLKPGQYTFRVIAANADGIWNQTGDAIAIELLPHFYQTAWFYCLSGGLGCAALFGLYLWRVRLLQRKQESLRIAHVRLEAEVAHRTAELARTNHSLTDEIQGHKQTTAQLEERTLSLENQIEERKRMQSEIERVHKELVTASRQAGMAEVATSVLHNVGNVLNSINVSSSLVIDGLRNSKIPNLRKISNLIDQHRDNLGAFFNDDPRGKQLADYFSNLAEHLNREQATLLTEMEATRKHIEHVKEIVKMQQSYARVGGVLEQVSAVELVEDAVRLNISALERHGVELVRDYSAGAPDLCIERHKVLQILVNLIANAKYACDESGRKEKVLTLQVRNGKGRVQIAVIDNGVGIPAENINRIFNHGFTTRKNGHGFGLHSGALAAKELGGALTAESAGRGAGARFILELPLQPPPSEGPGI
jgi:ligand-binding sensor domain-containing protein/signal transduction histidine kinase